MRRERLASAEVACRKVINDFTAQISQVGAADMCWLMPGRCPVPAPYVLDGARQVPGIQASIPCRCTTCIWTDNAGQLRAQVLAKTASSALLCSTRL